MQSNFKDNSIYFVETDKITPNPFQPRREFDKAQLDSLSDSIRMYGVLQPLVVTRKEVFSDDGGMSTEYELIAGERRLRASKLAGLREVPVIIRSDEQSDREKLEVAIIENLQREDLNPVDRAIAFRQLVDEFKLKHAEVAKKVGKSREYVSNSMRILALPEEMLQAITDKKMTEGHARTLLMLSDRPEEQQVLFKEILLKKLTVRAAEKIARRVAYDKVRKKERAIDPHTVEVEEEISETLGTRVHIERKAVGGKIEIDFFSEEDLEHILKVLKEKELDDAPKEVDEKMNNFVQQSGGLAAATNLVFEKEKENDPEPTTVKKEVDKVSPFSYDAQPDEKEEVTEEVSINIEDRKTNEDVVLEDAKDDDTVTPDNNVPDSGDKDVDIEIDNNGDINPVNIEGDKNEEIPKFEVDSKEVDNLDNDLNNSQYSDNQNDLPVNDYSKDDSSVAESVSVSSDFMPEKKIENPVKEEQPRSKYLEKIEPSDMGNANIQVGDGFLGDSPKSSPVENTESESHIVKEREELGFTQPNVITDFVESQKEKEKEDVQTPNYGNDDDLYSVKGM